MLMMRPSSLTFDEQTLVHFSHDLKLIETKTVARFDQTDIEHLYRVERRGRICALIGFATLWTFPNPVTAFLISFGQFTRWLLAHHILHRGYDKVPGIPKRYTSSHFAQGWRRFIDWFDWIHPRCWDYEHNILHHYHTGESNDPDLVERHSEFLKNSRIPRPFKYLLMYLAFATWKYTFYAPNTMSVMDGELVKRIRYRDLIYLSLRNILDLRNKQVQKLWTKCYLPYGLFHFAVIPSLFLPFGTQAFLFALINKFLAECITNLHGFFVIGPNHAGSDLFRYKFHYEDKGQFAVTQVMGSANYCCGTETLDHLQIWLNYQIEHHLFPSLPMLRYREVQPQVKELCKKYNIPYRQENIFKRFKKMTAVCLGDAITPQLEAFPMATSRI